MLYTDNSFVLVVSTLFSSAYRLMKSFNIPGTNINVFEFMMAAIVLFFIIKRVFPIIHLKAGDDSK